MNVDELKARFESREIRRVKVGGVDLDGVVRGKYISKEKFFSSIEKGFGFCDVVFGWDIADQLYDNAKVTGWDSGYPDALAKIDLATCRVLPQEPETACFLVDFHEADGKHVHPACPRNLLKRVISRAETKGFVPYFGAEFEFWLFVESPESVRGKNYAELQPLSPGMFGYSWLRAGQHSDFVNELLETLDRFDIDVEGFHTETGPGVWECALKYDKALEAADRAALFKTTVKQVAFEHGLVATFMAKWNAQLPGSSGHLHQSLFDSTSEKNLFEDTSSPEGLSELAKNYLGGLAKLAPELTALYSPFTNSYKRYVPGVWAPLTASWGIENRTCAIRAIVGGKGTRIEYRQTAADINPYTAMAAALGAGLYGIEHGLQPPAATKGDATEEGEPLPSTLAEATARLAQSDAAREILGEAFVDHYVRTRDFEVRQAQRAVTDWELARYFESV